MGKIIIAAIIVVIVLVLVLIGIFALLPKQENGSNQESTPSASLSLGQIMGILQNSSDYAEFLASAGSFDPELGNYFKLGPAEYQQIKPQWQEQGFEDRFAIVDELNLTDSTYWVELKNKVKGPNLLTIVDINQKTCLLVMGSIVIEAGMSL